MEKDPLPQLTWKRSITVSSSLNHRGNISTVMRILVRLAKVFDFRGETEGRNDIFGINCGGRSQKQR